MAGSKVLLSVALLLAIVLLLSSDVAARDLAEDSAEAKSKFGFSKILFYIYLIGGLRRDFDKIILKLKT